MKFEDFLKIYNSKGRTAAFVSYFNKGNSLTSTENNFLMEEYQKDKANGINLADSFARTLLILGNSKMIHSILYKQGYQDDEDKFMIGIIGLTKAIDRFDPSKDLYLSSYIYPAIKHELYNEYLKETRQKRTADVLSLDNEQTDEEGKNINFYNFLGEEDTELKRLKCETKDSIVDEILSHMSHKDQYLLIAVSGLYGEEISKKELANKFGISLTTMSNYFNHIKNRARLITEDKTNLLPREKYLKKVLLNTTYPVMSPEEYNKYNPNEKEPLPIKINSLSTFINESEHATLVDWIKNTISTQKDITLDSISKLSTKFQYYILDVSNFYSVNKLNPEKLHNTVANHSFKNALKDFAIVYTDRCRLSKDEFELAYPIAGQLLPYDKYVDYKLNNIPLPIRTSLHISQSKPTNNADENQGM